MLKSDPGRWKRKPQGATRRMTTVVDSETLKANVALSKASNP